MPEDGPKTPWRQWSPRETPKTQPVVLVPFIADSGEVWTEWDTTFSKFSNHRHAHCDEVAIARVFGNAAVKRSYAFKRDESRVLEPPLLERQLREASFVGEVPDFSKLTPR